MKNETSPLALDEIMKLVPGDASKSTEALFNLICATRSTENSHELLNAPEMRGTRFANLCCELAENGQKQKSTRLVRWLFHANYVIPGAIFIKLYNQNAFHSEAIMQAFLSEPDDLLPYVGVIIIALLAYQMNRLAEVNRALLQDDVPAWEPLLEAFVRNERMPEIIRSLPLPLRYYSGGTNTKLKMYDGYLRRLLPHFNLDAEFLGDLGGGYATADLNRVTKRVFTSLDILSPDITKGDPKNLILRKQVNPWTAVLLTQGERQEYIEKQAKIPWIDWNVLDDKPLIERLGDRASYSFTSFGFMSSSVRPFQDLNSLSNSHFDEVSRNACRRIVELASLGKDVSLLAIERATLRVRNQKAIALRWKDGHLIDVGSMQNPTRRLVEDTFLVSSKNF